MTAPALSWDVKLNITKVGLEPIADFDMYLFFEKGIRGGVSYISKKYSKANNKYLKPYDPKQESSDIIYLDANNLYGHVMFKFFPTSGFKWIDPKEFDFNIVQKVAFLKLILNIQKNYVNYIISFSPR